MSKRQDTIHLVYAGMINAGCTPETASDFCTLLTNDEAKALYEFAESMKLPTVRTMWFDYEKQEFRWDGNTNG